jgi:hypothetical protein
MHYNPRFDTINYMTKTMDDNPRFDTTNYMTETMDYNTRCDTATYRTERNGLQPNFNTNVKEKNKRI